MQTIQLRDHLPEIKALLELPVHSRARRKAFISLRNSLTEKGIVQESRFWLGVQCFAMLLAAAVFFWMALYGMHMDNFPEWAIWTWLGVMGALPCAGAYAQHKINLDASRAVHALVDAFAPRLTALTPEVYETLDRLLCYPLNYWFAKPTQSPAVCGCIRCGKRFRARDISQFDPWFSTPHCPHCGADVEYLVYSDENVNVTEENLTLLRKLFDEEN